LAVIAYAEIKRRILDALVINSAANVPISFGASTEGDDAINAAYALVFEDAGGTLKADTHANIWATAAASGVITLTSTLTSIGEIIHLWVNDTLGATGPDTGTFFELQKAPGGVDEIQWCRANLSSTQGGVYSRPMMYAISKPSTTSPTSVNKLTAEIWPAATATYKYFPAHYIPQFTVLDSVTVTTPDVNDIQSYDIPYLAAIDLAPRIDAQHLIPGLRAKLSDTTRAALARRESSLDAARQDR